jgi:hypothetical protein
MHPSISRAGKPGILCLIVGFLMTATAAAGQYTISWTGLVQPSGASDPWSIGPAPSAFAIEVDVPRDAADYASLDIPNASFDLTMARLSIGGQTASFVGPAGITFTDGGIGAGGVLIDDSIFFGGEFSLNGNVAGFAAFFGIDRTSFTFTELVELTPVFPSTNVVTIPGPGNTSTTYSVSVPLGTPVTVVPEPEGICIVLAAMSALLFRLRLN